MKEKFEVYTTILRFLPYKVTDNLLRIYLNVNFKNHTATLTSFYQSAPSELELELFDDICTNSIAHLPELFVQGETKIIDELDGSYDFVIFAKYDDSMGNGTD